MITIGALDEDGRTIIVDTIKGRAQAQRRLAQLRREDPTTIYFLL